MTQYRKGTKVVEAFKWQPDHMTMAGEYPWPEWLKGNTTFNGDKLEVWTTDGILSANQNDWIIKWDNGKIFVIEYTIFDTYYNVVGD